MSLVPKAPQSPMPNVSHGLSDVTETGEEHWLEPSHLCTMCFLASPGFSDQGGSYHRVRPYPHMYYTYHPQRELP